MGASASGTCPRWCLPGVVVAKLSDCWTSLHGPRPGGWPGSGSYRYCSSKVTSFSAPWMEDVARVSRLKCLDYTFELAADISGHREQGLRDLCSREPVLPKRRERSLGF